MLETVLTAALLLVDPPPSTIAVGERVGIGFCVDNAPGWTATGWFLFKRDLAWTPRASEIREISSSPQRCYRSGLTIVYTGTAAVPVDVTRAWGLTYVCLSDTPAADRCLAARVRQESLVRRPAAPVGVRVIGGAP
jgi:hypothetical protein